MAHQIQVNDGGTTKNQPTVMLYRYRRRRGYARIQSRRQRHARYGVTVCSTRSLIDGH